MQKRHKKIPVVPAGIRPFYFWFSLSFNAFPGLNFGVFDAAIFIVSPVAGFLPSRAALFPTPKVPKPMICTS
jgi:hypothetical protein